MSVPNQRKIIIERERESLFCSKDFFKVTTKNLQLAMYNLKPSAFMLWIYFADNKNGYVIDVYVVDFINKTGLSRSSYNRAFEELIEKGYLIKSHKQSNLYLFKEKSESNNICYFDKVQCLESDKLEKMKDEYF